jgi:hypothetical protein
MAPRPVAPVVVCIPSSDAAFHAAVAAVLDRATADRPDALQRGVRIIYPSALVRRRDLSAEQAEIWYAYRDGSFAPPAAESWADQPGVAWARFHRQTGEILAANGEMADLFAGGGDIVGRFAREFIPEGADEISNRQLRAVAEAGETRSAGLGRRSDGSQVLVEFVARPVGDDVEAWYREVAIVMTTDGPGRA